MSTFDKESFMAGAVEGEMQVKYTPIPIGEYNAYLEDVEAVELGKDNSPALRITVVLTDDSLKEALSMDKPQIIENVFLDFTESGSLDFGVNKNVRLGRIREACGQNTPAPWSPNQLRNAGPVKIKVEHRFDKNTGEGPYANITRWAKG